MKKGRYGQLAGGLLALVLITAAEPVGAQVPQEAVYINEIQVSTSGTDWEFFELQGAPGTDLSNLTLVQVESDAGDIAGTIDLALSLADQTIPADGFWLGVSPAGEAAYGVTGELSFDDNSFENSTATYFLVSDFTGAEDDDLDADDDGSRENGRAILTEDAPGRIGDEAGRCADEEA